MTERETVLMIKVTSDEWLAKIAAGNLLLATRHQPLATS